MDVEGAVFLGQGALLTALLVAGPALLTALVVGSLVSMVQTVTQVQEVTLVFVPKITIVFLVIALLGGWMMQHTVAYGTNSFESIAETR